MQVLIQDQTTAVWEKLRMSQVSADIELYAPLDEYGSIAQALWFRLPSALSIPTICNIRYVTGAAYRHANKHGGITLRRRFCTTTRREMSIRVIEGLVLKSLPESECCC